MATQGVRPNICIILYPAGCYSKFLKNVNCLFLKTASSSNVMRSLLLAVLLSSLTGPPNGLCGQRSPRCPSCHVRQWDFHQVAHPPLQPLTVPLRESLPSDWSAPGSSDTGFWAWAFRRSRNGFWLGSGLLALLRLVVCHYLHVVVTCRAVIGPRPVGSALASWFLDADWLGCGSHFGPRACLITSTFEIVFPYWNPTVHFSFSAAR